MEQIKIKISSEPDIKVSINDEPNIKVKIDGTRGDAGGIFAPLVHTHVINNVSGLQTALDSKANAIHNHNDIYYTEAEIDLLLADKSDLNHNHAIIDITGLQTALDSKQSNLTAGTGISIVGNTISSTSSGATNLSTNYSSSSVTVNSDTGNDATINSATTTNAGVLSASDKTKLDGIQNGATANQTDSYLLNRANHTGNQTSSTISDFSSTVNNILNNTSIDSLLDVDLTGLSNGKILAFNSTTNKFEPVTPSTGSGDMLKSTYDTNNSGVVDDSEKLGGNNSSYHLDRTNHTGTQPYSTITTTYNKILGRGSLGAGQVEELSLGTGLSLTGNTLNADIVSSVASQDSFIATAGQVSFTLSSVVSGATIVTINGLQQKITTDYTISGNTLTMTYGLTLNDEVIVTYGTALAGGGGGSSSPDIVTLPYQTTNPTELINNIKLFSKNDGFPSLKQLQDDGRNFDLELSSRDTYKFRAYANSSYQVNEGATFIYRQSSGSVGGITVRNPTGNMSQKPNTLNFSLFGSNAVAQIQTQHTLCYSNDLNDYQGGFSIFCRFGLQTSLENGKVFFGATQLNQLASPSAINITDWGGVGLITRDTDTNWQFYAGNDTGTSYFIDTGFAITNGDLLEFRCYVPVDGTYINFQLKNVGTGTVFNYKLTTNPLTNNLQMYGQMILSALTTSGTKTLGVNFFEIQANYI